MYADDTSIYCIGENGDVAVAALNNALQEVQRWCIDNRLTPHPAKSEAMVLSRKAIARPLPPRHVLLKFYYSPILPSVKYGIILWGSCTSSDLVNSVNSLHCRAA